MFPDFFMPEQDFPFDLKNTKRREIPTAESFRSGFLSYEVENIWLE